ncbi:MAG: hypothetical protein NXI31_23025 [bacterium]|nr:hypothetical protein [bacterium]
MQDHAVGSRSRFAALTLAAVFAWPLAACDWFGGSAGGDGPESDPFAQTAPVEVYPNPFDPRLLATIDDAGNQVRWFGTKDSEGRVLAATHAIVTPKGEMPITVRYDAEQRPTRFEQVDGAGLDVEWRADGLAHFRFFDEFGAVQEELWVDRSTSTVVPVPERPGGGPASALVPGGTAGEPDGPFDPLVVRVPIRDCNGNPSAASASYVEQCHVELRTPLGTFPVPAVRDGDHFVARLPRNLNTAEMSEEICEALLAWTGEVCPAINDPTVGGAMLAVCEHPSIVLNPWAFAACVAANVAINIYCLNAELGAEVLCTIGAVAVDPFGAAWSALGERSIRAVAQIRTCEGLEQRVSERVVITHETTSKQLPIDGCQDEAPIDWVLIGGTREAGFAFAGTGRPTELILPGNTQAVTVPIGAPIPELGPVTEADDVFVPNTFSPIWQITIEETATYRCAVGENGGSYATTLDIRRDQTELRAPTPQELNAGVEQLAQNALQSRREMDANLTAFYSVTLRPFQKLVLRLDVQGGAAPGTEHEALYSQHWPLVNGSGYERLVRGPGGATIEITHDELRRAYEEFYGQIPLPQNHNLPSQGLVPPTQCLRLYFTVRGDSVLEVGEAVHGALTARTRFDLRIVR